MDLWLEAKGFIQTQKMATKYVSKLVKRKYIYTKS